MKILNLAVATTLTIAFTIPVNAGEVYPEKEIKDVYVLSIEGDKALIKTKGAEKESVIVGDVIGQERMSIIKIDSLSIELSSEDGKIVTTIPVGGGINY